jgi:NADH-ubiquinone oxidoreductase chain 5
MGSLSVYMPCTCSSLIVSNFALCGMPFLAGFYSSSSVRNTKSLISKINLRNQCI